MFIKTRASPDGALSARMVILLHGRFLVVENWVTTLFKSQTAGDIMVSLKSLCLVLYLCFYYLDNLKGILSEFDIDEIQT